jgi:membrane fusion protein, multidrug efflux system
VTVPSGAVGQASGQDFVWAIEKGALVRRIIVTGRRDAASGRVEVVKGLGLDAQILAVRFDNLKEGAPAKVVAQRSVAQRSVANAASGASAPVGSSPSASASAAPVSRS